jgi:hypothetical protein
VQDWKQNDDIRSTDLGMQIDFSDEQSRKAHDSMRFNLEFESKTTVWRELQD